MVLRECLPRQGECRDCSKSCDLTSTGGPFPALMNSTLGVVKKVDHVDIDDWVRTWPMHMAYQFLNHCSK